MPTAQSESLIFKFNYPIFESELSYGFLASESLVGDKLFIRGDGKGGICFTTVDGISKKTRRTHLLQSDEGVKVESYRL